MATGGWDVGGLDEVSPRLADGPTEDERAERHEIDYAEKDFVGDVRKSSANLDKSSRTEVVTGGTIWVRCFQCGDVSFKRLIGMHCHSIV